MNFRGKPRAIPSMYGPTYLPLPEDHPRLAKCNPLTWECRKEKHSCSKNKN